VYAANTASSTLAWYSEPAVGDIVPRNVITGNSTTGIFGPTYIFVGSDGMIWCSNAQPGNTNVSKYDPNALPNTPPIVQIAGRKTHLGPPEGLAVDAAGELYVANGISNDILVFKSGASGDAKPVRRITGKNTLLNNPTGLALDPAGNTYVANGNGTYGGSVVEFAPDANKNALPLRVIQGLDTKLVNPRGIALDALGQIYVTTSSSVLIFAADSVGDAPPLGVISGSKTMMGSNGQVAVDKNGDIFVASAGKNALVEFSAGVVGNAAPLAAIAGAATQLSSPTGIAVR
jgi:sugar lactone lactonase YvrE